jgi:SPP1 family phage portal protein
MKLIDINDSLKPSLILSLINEDSNSRKKQKAKIAQRYYEGEHDIKNYRVFYFDDNGQIVEDDTRSNIKISHPFFTELVDQKAQYFLSGKDSFVKSDNAKLQKELDYYFGDDFKKELMEQISGSSVKGFDYIYAKKNKDDKICFEYADGMGVIEVQAKDNGNPNDDNDYIIYYYVDTQRTEQGVKEVLKIQVWDKNKTYFYERVNGIKGKVKKGDVGLQLDKDAKINPRPHVVYQESDKTYGNGFDFIPFWRLDNNRKQISDLKPIKALIDDYDLMSCGLSNNLQDISEGVYVVKGYNGSDLSKLQQNIRSKKIVGVGKEGDLDIRTINIPYQARQTKLELDEKNIYRFGMGFNSSQLGDGNITNVVIKSRYTLLDLKCNKLEANVKKLIRELLEPVLHEINEKNKSGYTQEDVYIEFEREVITNELDNVQIELVEAQKRQTEIGTLLNIASKLDDVTLMELVFEQLDLNYEDYKDEIEAKAKENMIDINEASEELANAKIEETLSF